MSTSGYTSFSAVTNNTFVIPRSQSCRTCTAYSRVRCRSYSERACTQLSLYCYSNSTSSSVRYLVWPNGNRYHQQTNYYHVDASQVNPGGLLIHNHFNYRPYGGVYTCRMPDSNEDIIEMSIGIYSSLPSQCNKTFIVFSCYMAIYLQALLLSKQSILPIYLGKIPVTCQLLL